ncbi:hypothetical protein [Amycolatopsis solani]|uniref:hypothetical protein n=1 Tax=Amycolatopsis solani TaxID=3028615 RepID=UPI0025B1D2AA|nr:hypothetical protein [Amycolatopsis sp. MEP2-6]
MLIFRRLIRVFFVFAVAAGVVGPGVAAAATQTTPHCGSNIVCWYRGINFTRGADAWTPIVSGDCLSFAEKGAGVGESAGNGSDYPARFWSNGNCTGINKIVNPQTENPNLGFQAFSLGGI